MYLFASTLLVAFTNDSESENNDANDDDHDNNDDHDNDHDNNDDHDDDHDDNDVHLGLGFSSNVCLAVWTDSGD